MKIYCRLAALIIFTALCNTENLPRNRGRNSKNEPSPDRFNYFDIELLQERTRTENGNVVLSPASVKALMAMILEGSGGQSAEQLKQALRIEESEDVYRLQLSAFLKSLKAQNSGYTVELGNRLFLSTRVEPRKEYSEALEKYYHADVRQVDFSSPHTATSINDWVKYQTHGLIDRLVEPDQISPYSKMMFVNAIYFKGKWKIPFDREVTSVKNFYPENGVCLRTFYMEILGSYPYAYIEELNAHALELPYEGNKYSMLLLMPNVPTGIHQLVRDLPFNSLKNIVQKLVKTEVLVSIPRFKMEYSTDLVTSISNLGVQDIFGAKANLSAMLANEELNYITNIIHKAKLEVNEEGSIAGAGTGAIVVPLMGKTVPKFHPNRPFLFFIRDLEIGTVLFEGQVTLPETANGTCSDIRPNQQPPVQPTSTFNQQVNKETQQRQNVQPHQSNSDIPHHITVQNQNQKYNSDNDSIQFSNSS